MLKWHCHHMPKACSPYVQETNEFEKEMNRSFLDKYLMYTYQASVRAKVNGRSQVIKTEVRAMNVQDARWLLWAQYGFHSIQAGPHLLKAT
jgi:hypothetical protein